MRIALIHSSYKPKRFSENLNIVDEEFCVAPPIILAYVAAILERHGHKVMLLDSKALELSKEEALKNIALFRPDLLGFRAETYHFHDALEYVRYLKQGLNVPVIAGGINLLLYPKETLLHSEIDYGLAGEAIESLPRFLSALENGDDFRQIPGLIYRNKEGAIIANPISEKYADFDSYPFPSRHLLPNDRYYSFISQRKNFTIMVTSTGCPFRCSFCAIHPHTKYRFRTPKNVVDEIEICYREFGVREIDFFDAVFFLNKPRLMEIFNEIYKRRIKIEWSCRTRVDVVDREILNQAAKAGCRQIYYGIESVSHKILSSIKKDVDLKQIKDAITWTRHYGIRTMGFFMVGNPGDTKETVRETMEFAKKLKLDFIQVCRAIAKPGTDFDKLIIEKTGKDYWRSHVAGEQIDDRLPTPWSILSESEEAFLTKEFYLKFYFRPIIVWNRLVHLKSFNEIKRYIRVTWKMLLQKTEIVADTYEAEKSLIESAKYLLEAREAKIAIVIPTYNEKDNIKEMLFEISENLPNAHMVVVDDGSPDGTGVIVEELAKTNSRLHAIHRTGKRGLGLAYIDGFKFVLSNLDSDFIFEMDSDFSHNPQYIPLFLHYAKRHDLVTGSRFLKGVSIKNRSLWRNVISKSTKWVVNILMGLRLSDATTGFKCFRREILKRVDFNTIGSRGYAFQIEVSYHVNRFGGTIKEIPILFTERIHGNSKMSLDIFLEGIYLVLKLSLRRLNRGKE
ncbi:MAG: glycosyltransferase [Candidatus Omnitrophica bacterium]|nr:glycosyltransferase [Candidatus Omnitrophota bacterium]